MEQSLTNNKNKSGKKTYVVILFVVFLILALAYFLKGKVKSETPATSPVAKVTFEDCYNKVTHTECPNNTACLANPASSFCQCMGGISKIQNTADGQVGMCEIDGREVDEWQYFRENTKAFQPQE